jgi:hypothetical protein
MIPRDEWFPRLVRWKNWEIQKPGKESIVGFFVVLAASLMLHATVLLICQLFRG